MSYVSHSTLDECEAVCGSTNDCNWWTFDSAVEMCTMFVDKEAIDAMCSTCVTGMKLCSELHMVSSFSR